MTEAVALKPPVDYNRGAVIRMHPDGFDVNMYKDQPGTFYDVNGKQISATIALEAGYDVKHLMTLKEKRDRITAARDSIEREYGEPVDEVVASAGGFTAVSLGNGLYAILDEDGTRLVDEPMDRDEAIALVNKLAPSAAEAMGEFDVEPEDAKQPEAGEASKATAAGNMGIAPVITSHEYAETG